MVVPKGYEQVVKSLWNDRCTVVVRRSGTDTETGRERKWEESALEDEPCRIVYRATPVTGNQRGAPALAQTILLLIDRAAELPPGSKIIVLREDETAPKEYQHAGEPNVYTVHKEITLEQWGGWA
jgi:hypothetical protein